MDHYGRGMGMGMYGGGMILGGILGLLLIIAIIALIVWAVITVTRPRHQMSAPPQFVPPQGAPGSGPAVPQGPTPEEILRQRYAAGEIDDEDYQHRLTTLRK